MEHLLGGRARLGNEHGVVSVGEVGLPRFRIWGLARRKGPAYNSSRAGTELEVLGTVQAEAKRVVRIEVPVDQVHYKDEQERCEGVAGAVGVSRVMRSLLFDVTAMDLATFVTAPLVLLVVATTACLIPAWRASRTDPARVLRDE